MLSTLPSPIDAVQVPKYFSPSNWERLTTCRLAAFYVGGFDLPQSPEAIVGQIVHEVRARLIDLPELDASAVLEDVINRFDTELAVSGDAELVPLYEKYGRQAWAAKLALVKASLRDTPNAAAVHQSAIAAMSPVGTSNADQVPLGAEKTWICNSLRLKGRVDQAFRDRTGSVVIVDFKSGHIVGRDGEVKAGIAAQVGLYALIARRLGERPERALLVGADSIEHRFSADELNLLEKALLEFLDGNPQGKKWSAEEVANPGPICRSCRIRPRCAAYLHAAPSWWSNDGEQPRPLPLDIWGSIIGASQSAHGLDVRVRDPRGNEVVIRGIRESSEIGNLAKDQYLYAFNLQATQDVFQHGRILHPRSLHQNAPNRRWKSALRARFYSGAPIAQLDTSPSI